jgi:hypothetical protein
MTADGYKKAFWRVLVGFAFFVAFCKFMAIFNVTRYKNLTLMSGIRTAAKGVSGF